MRHQKGSIDINQETDIPLLLQVLRSQWITHNQLFQFMRIGGYEPKRSSFNWRVRRLVQHGFLERHYVPGITSGCVYRLGSRATYLTAIAALLAMRPRKRLADPRTCIHWTEVTSIHLSLVFEPGLLEKWESEIEVVARNDLEGDAYAKDYDAVVTLRRPHGLSTFALEYERTTKRKADYFEIRDRLESERYVDFILYLVNSDSLLFLLEDVFHGIDSHLYLGRASEFVESPLDARVIDATDCSSTFLLTALCLPHRDSGLSS